LTVKIKLFADLIDDGWNFVCWLWAKIFGRNFHQINLLKQHFFYQKNNAKSWQVLKHTISSPGCSVTLSFRNLQSYFVMVLLFVSAMGQISHNWKF
jgi:hypothetical protein